MLRLLALVAAFSTLLALSGLLELVHCDDDHGDVAGGPTACVCICHGGVAVLPDSPVLSVSCSTPRPLPQADDVRRPQDALIAIEPPPDKSAG